MNIQECEIVDSGKSAVYHLLAQYKIQNTFLTVFHENQIQFLISLCETLPCIVLFERSTDKNRTSRSSNSERADTL